MTLRILKFLVLLFVSFFQPINIIAQQDTGQEIHLPPYLTDSNHHYEFSSLAKWNGYVLLVPTIKRDSLQYGNCKIFGIPNNEIEKSLMDIKYEIPDSLIIKIAFDSRIKQLLRNISDYDGIEGTATVPNSNDIYFSIETKTSPCYIVKAIISLRTVAHRTIYSVSSNTTPLAIEKPASSGKDDGFEAFTYLPNVNKLLVGFELYQSYTAYEIDLNLNNNYQTYHPLFYNRLTDFYAKPNDELVCITSYLRNYTVGDCKYEIQIINYKAMPQPKYPIGATSLNNNECHFNWEGITPFDSGVLLINDNWQNGKPPEKSRLSYFKLN